MVKASIGFSEFRELLDLWDENVSAEKIDSMIDTNQFVMFFKREKDILATNEDGRMTFARMKHPDPDDPPNWLKEATFSANNLSKALEGDKEETIISYKDVDNIKVIGIDEAKKHLRKQAEKVDVTKIKVNLKKDDPNDLGVPDNMDTIKGTK